MAVSVFYIKRGWRLLLIFLLLAIAARFVGDLLVGACRMVMSTMSERLVPIYSVARDDKKVSLSFDAMWGTDYTDKILAILRKHGIKTTFFLGGYWLEKYPDYVKKIASEGHEIGNHTYSHPHLNALSREQIREELMRAHDIIKSLTGKDSRLFRPPFGEYSNKVIEVAKECGYETIQWSVDSLDWQDLSAQAIVDRIMGKIHNGAIILMHNNGTHTAEAVETLIPMLKEQGYEIVPISELLIKGEYYIHPHTGEQRPVQRPEQGRGTVSDEKKTKQVPQR
ncbi:MAG TPA: polysaccharide deacetylase family protein [Firmicutes bacterium]|nr:polysaccharide deacetylase family protein [Bacillota bacterium]